MDELITKLKSEEKEWLLKENEYKEDIKRCEEKSEINMRDNNSPKVGDELKTVKKESHKLKEQMIAFEKIVEQSNNIAEDYKTQNDNLRQKTLTLSEKLRKKQWVRGKECRIWNSNRWHWGVKESTVRVK